ncbi:hypothetical protein Aduo_016142 [Ancylostoma duodenale]
MPLQFQLEKREVKTLASPLPRVRPAVPAPPREPVVIAQYARRFPQPPAGEGLHIEKPGVRNTVDLSHENDAATPAGHPSRSEDATPSTPAPISTTPATTTTFTTITMTSTVPTVAPSTESETLLEVTDNPIGIIPSTTALSEENTSEDVSATENYPEDSTQRERESFPITVDEQEAEEYDSDELESSEEQSLPVTDENGTSSLPTPTTESTISLSTAVSSTTSQQKPPVASNHKPRTAVNIKGTSFIITEQSNREELKKQVETLRKRIRKTKKKLSAGLKTSTSTAVEGPAVEGDTARALSWMIANVAKLMDENANMPVVDKVPIEKVDAETDQVLSRLSSGVEVISEQDQFILKEDASNDPVVKVDRQTSDDSRMADVEWSEWSSCNCGAQSRKSMCVSASDLGSHAAEIDYRKRQRRSPRSCDTPEYETRPCHSDKCQL